jgi:cation transport ATPase
MNASPVHPIATATLALTTMHCTGCANAIERTLRANPHIVAVHLDWAHNSVHVRYHPDQISPEQIEVLIATTGCDCMPETSKTQQDHAAHEMGHVMQPSGAGRLEQLRHAVDVQPITMGTKHDRMQYELPATNAHAHHHTHVSGRPRAAAAPVTSAVAQPSPADQFDASSLPMRHDTPGAGTAGTIDHSAHVDMHHDSPPGVGTMDHGAHMGMRHDAPNAEDATDHSSHVGMRHDSSSGAGVMDHSAHAGMHHGMDHDMSDPGMAAAMERDMRTKFFIALVLTIPTVLYSPLGMNVLGVNLPTFGIDMNIIMLVLSTPVVWYCGWMFIAGAYESLRRRMLNMSVLIAVGVLAAYLFSLLITVLGGETFFEAAAMLVTFVLFGHWMEMRSRRGTNAALRALFDLVPPQAAVLRDGQELTIPSAEVQVGDTVLLRPGDKVPVDGEVTDGETAIDEALVTGESAPVTKRPGDAVIAGSINRSGSVRFRATKVGADTALAQIVELVQRAQSSKAPGQRLADQAAQYLVILAVGSGIMALPSFC